MVEGGKSTMADAIVGLREEERIIMEDLLDYRKELYVISIVGMPGVGKTTLASTLYNSPSVADHFDIRAWCTVSQSYQIRALLLSILDQVNESDQVSKVDDQDLADHLCQNLKGRGFLIVLDDVWDTGFWNYLRTYLPNSKGNRILITTRNRDVAVRIGSKVNELHGLSKESSLKLFKKKMLQIETLSDNLMSISERIVEDCNGLPLSIVIIVGILSDIERTEKTWNQIAEAVSLIVLSDPQKNCKAILGLSYNLLPKYLRLCFLYLGSFPVDKEISVNHLTSLWIAEGLVRDTETDSAEEVAKKYIGDLIAKSLVIPAKKRSLGGVKTFLLHDLLHDFCLDKAKEKQFLTFLDKTTDSRLLQDSGRVIINGTPIKGLDFSYQSIQSMICYDEFDVFEIEKGIRSCDMLQLQVLEVDKACSKLFKVRDKDDAFSNPFPNISILVYLRYLALGLEDWVFSFLPSSICTLHDLQILILRFDSLVKVPDLIWDMTKLRHVHISPRASFEIDSNRLENSSFLLEKLRFLSRAQVSCGDSKWLSKLLGLQRLSCAFVEDDQFQMLSFNGHLTSLKVENATGRERRFISTCQLPDNLGELTLSYFFLTSDDISKIGRAVPHLVFFKIYNCYVPTRYEWNVDDDDFPMLKVLKLRNLNISKWNASEGSFPNLEQLWLEDCNYLDEIPLDFGNLPELRLISVKKCSPSVDESARIIEKMQHEKQNTRMRVHMHLQKNHFNRSFYAIADDLLMGKNDLDVISIVGMAGSGKTTMADAVVGLRAEERIITEDLLDSEKELYLISGMPGIGKTTLASTLYNTPSMAYHFDIRAWCTVSQSYQIRALLLSILHQVNDSDQVSNMDDQDLVDHLCRKLKGRRFLVVLDDVWDTGLWNYLRKLPNSKGNRILITTRNRDVAVQIGSKVNELHGLSKESSLKLFKKKMLEIESLPDNLMSISERIVEDCKGLPLSIVIIAGILSDIERTETRWKQIAESVSSIVFLDPQGNCKAILGLSYNQLPNHLRLCFLYLGSFPEDKEISVYHLTSLWIAEGLVRDTETDSAEEVAKKYIGDLIAKSLVIPAKNRSLGGVKTFLLHDLLRDFCSDKAKEERFLTFLDKTNDSQPLQVPRLVIINGAPINGLDFSYQSIRSIICYDEFEVVEIKKGIKSCDMVLLEVLEVDKVCSKLFQVVDEDDVCSNSFPDISSLAHLRYLAFGLEDWVISSLPSSICKLQNLQTLILRFESLVKVPDLIWEMLKLRHVHITPGASFEVHSNTLENSFFLLESLKFLSRAQVSCGDSKWLSKLSGLQRLSCVFMEDDSEVDDDLEVGAVTKVDDVEDNQFQMLSFNGHLTSLKVENATRLEQRFITTCQLPDNLGELTLSYFFMTSDDISKIGRAVPHLVFFKIYNCYVPTRYEWNVDDDDFPMLKVLKLRNLNIYKWNASEDSFPSLEQLWLEDCKYLDEIPLHFGYLPELCLISVKKCAPSVDESARIIENMQHEAQNTRMRVHIHLQKNHFNRNSDAIVGLHEEAKIIADYLLMGGNHWRLPENNLNVISIVGMAGAGKTTLAFTVYFTPSIMNHFDILAWCTVSQNYQYRDLMLSILDEVHAPDKSHRSISDDQELKDHMCRSLKKRRYLIVLDDIWEITLWNNLRRYLPNDTNGSRILITTRNRDVADQMGGKVNELHGLSEENSWELFQKKMLGQEGLSDDLLKISKEIVKNCKGLPLSIVSIAETLSDTERTEEKWNEIAENVSSLILSGPQGKSKIALELSYTELPNHLRSCFLYLGSFPEDQDISVNRLISLWIAEGFIRDTKSDSAEEIARKYIQDLIEKCLVIPTKEKSLGGLKALRLHNLLRDFCLDKAKEKHYFTVLNHKNHSRPLQDPRRLIINGPRSLDFSCPSIQSMICYDPLESLDVQKGIGYRKMVLLKVLEVREVFSELFRNLSSLVHLRYLAMLNLQNWRNSVLPSSISKLQNLQFLILTCTDQVIEVPDFIWDMVKLRHIHIREKASFEVDGNRLESSAFLLENLRSLSNAIVSCDDSKWLKKLFALQRLRCVFEEDNIEGDDGQEKYDVIEHNKFRMLSFNEDLISLKVENRTNLVQRFISTCQLPKILQKLTLSNFYLESNDFSIIGQSLSRLEVFKIYCCGVPSGYEWNVDDEDFPKLKVLKLLDLKISEWNASEYSFPSLEELWVEHCNYLDEIPLDFGSLLNLRLISVRECAPSVDNSAREIGKIQHEDLNTEMRVHIYSG